MANSDDAWQAQVTREAAKAMGQWLEARGRLDRPIRSLSMHDLDCMASNAIARFVVLSTRRIRAQPDQSDDLMWLLSG